MADLVDRLHLDIAVIGAGPAGLMAAETLALGGARVTVYDRMPSPGRKFLLAGRGGLNLTHSEPLASFVARYGTAEPHLRPALDELPPESLRAWCEDLGQPTFVGTSGRVFPRSMKASPLLRAWLRRLDGAGVAFRMRHRWSDWEPDGLLRFDTPDGPSVARPDATVLALGGASWPQLGSDGAWTAPFAQAGIAVAPLLPSNCGFTADWTDLFRARFEGQPLKGVGLSFEGRQARGDVVITRTGLEGGPLYALSGPLRDRIAAEGAALLHVVLRPDLDRDAIETRLRGRPSKASLSTVLRKRLALAPAAIGLVNEARRGTASTDAAALAALVASLPLRLTGTAPIGRAISTAGGVSFAALGPDFMLTARPGTFVAGEMLDWEAPTGGYLLQAAFATGAAAARGALAWATAHQGGSI